MVMAVIWTVYVPAVSLAFFIVWMLRITLRALGMLGKVRREVEQLAKVLAELKASRRFSEQRERWLSDMYGFISSRSFGGDNPLLELVNRVYAMSELASPNLAAALEATSEREVEKLEPVREAPNSLLLLGIMGTVIGMVLALATFGAVGFEDGGGAIDIGRIMTSMFLAFVSTGVALFLSVFLRARLEQVGRQQGSMLAELESYAFTQLAPALLPKQDGLVQQRFHELMDRQQTLLGDSLAQSVETLGEFSATLGRAQRLTEELSANMVRNAAALSDTGQRLVKDLNSLETKLGQNLLGGLERLGAEMAQQRQSLEVLYRDTQLAVREDKELGRQQVDLLQKNSGETTKLLQAQNRELAASLSALAQQLASNAQQQTGALEALRRDVARLSEALLESQEHYQRTFLQTVQDFLQRQFDDLAKSLRLGRRR